MKHLLDIEGLTVRSREGRAVLDAVSLGLDTGDRVGVVGESGAGKTTLALAALGVLRRGLSRSAGTVELAGHDTFRLRERARRRLRRTTTAWLGQDPAAALTPTMTVGSQIGELLTPDRRDAVEICRRLAAVGLPDDPGFLRRLPGELSGGQQQRLGLARALTGAPQLLVMDEPTSRVDPVTRSVILEELDRRYRTDRFGILLISHDLELIARLTDTVLVLRGGRVMEAGPTRSVLRSPSHPYTRRLRDAQPDPRRSVAPSPNPSARAVSRLSAHNLHASYGDTPVLCDVDVSLAAGEALALVGASGSGKSTLARCLIGLHRPDRGHLRAGEQELAAAAADRSRAQRRLIQLIGQDPTHSLHPRRRAGASVARPAWLLSDLSRSAARARAGECLADVGIPEQLGHRFPHELSGGERQRVAIARALAAGPTVLICDEITSALDATVAAEVLALLTTLRRRHGLAMLFITHDLGLAAGFADRVVVLEHGRVVEQGTARAVLTSPTSPAAMALVGHAPSLSATLTDVSPPVAVDSDQREGEPA